MSIIFRKKNCQKLAQFFVNFEQKKGVFLSNKEKEGKNNKNKQNENHTEWRRSLYGALAFFSFFSLPKGKTCESQKQTQVFFIKSVGYL